MQRIETVGGSDDGSIASASAVTSGHGWCYLAWSAHSGIMRMMVKQ